MPRDGAIIFSGLIGKLDLLREVSGIAEGVVKSLGSYRGHSP